MKELRMNCVFFIAAVHSSCMINGQVPCPFLMLLPKRYVMLENILLAISWYFYYAVYTNKPICDQSIALFRTAATCLQTYYRGETSVSLYCKHQSCECLLANI